MNNRKVQQIAVGFGLFSMALMVSGSLLAGARLLTSILRGVEGAVVFGLLAWCFCSALGGDRFMTTKVANKPKNGPDRSDAGLNID